LFYDFSLLLNEKCFGQELLLKRVAFLVELEERLLLVTDEFLVELDLLVELHKLILNIL
jgi:hypothetical protein